MSFDIVTQSILQLRVANNGVMKGAEKIENVNCKQKAEIKADNPHPVDQLVIF